MKNYYIQEIWFDLYDSKGKREESIIFETDDPVEIMKKAKSIALSHASIDSTSSFYLFDKRENKCIDIRNFI